MNAVLFAPHNDDETLFASYLILRYRPKVIVCLRSERMHEPGYPGGPLDLKHGCADPYQDGRAQETGRALFALRGAGLLGQGGFEQWDFGDSDPDWKDVGRTIEANAQDYDLCIAPAFEEGGNNQHNQVAIHAERAWPRDRLIRYTTYTADGRSRGKEVPFEPDWPARKLAALACYRSQIAHPATAPHFLDGGLREYVA